MIPWLLFQRWTGNWRAPVLETTDGLRSELVGKRGEAEPNIHRDVDADCETVGATNSRLLDLETLQHKSPESNRISSATSIDQIARLLKNEHPQTITAVVSTLAPARAAILIQSLTADQQYDIVRRLAEMQPTDVESLHEVEKELREQLQREQELAGRSQDGWQAVRSILGSADSKLRSEIMDNLCQFDQSLVSRLQTDAETRSKRNGGGGFDQADSALSFESLVELESSVLATLFESVPHRLTATAFAGASPHDLNNLMSRLPATLASHLREELAAIGPLCLSEIHDAQSLIAKAAKGLLRDRANQSHGSSRLRLSA